MFCPKCGTQNPDDGKFCRSCGANLSNVLAVVRGDLKGELGPVTQRESSEMFSTGVRNVVLGFGFAATGVFLFTMPGNTFFWLLAFIAGFSLLASGISKILRAEALKEEKKILINPVNHSVKELPPTQTDYVSPQKTKFQTEDLSHQPLSVTDETTRQLQMKSDDR